MSTLQVFEMSPVEMAVDLKVLGMNVDLEQLKASGAQVVRFNLRDHADDFHKHPQVMAEMGQQGEHLPILMLDQQIVSKAIYPTRQQLASWVQVSGRGSGGCGGGSCSCGG